MKKNLLLAFFIFSITVLKAQNTYYWVGGTGNNAAVSFTTNSKWNTALDGSGTTRAIHDSTDILIVDGSNIGGATPATGNIIVKAGSDTMGQLILRNGANLNLLRLATGTGAIRIKGDQTNAFDIQIDATSTLTSSVSDSVITLNSTSGNNLTLMANATAKIYGTLIVNNGTSKIVSLNTTSGGSVFFESGSICKVNTLAASNYPFGTGSTGNSGYSLPNSFVFNAGSKLIFMGGNCPFTTSSSYTPVVFKPGSTLRIESSIPVTGGLFTPSNFFSTRLFSNVEIGNNAVVNADAFYNIDNLTIDQGASFFIKASGLSPVSGNVLNNGTMGSISPFTSSNLLFKGLAPQTIGGTGIFQPFGAVSVATDSYLTLYTNVVTNGSSNSLINGKINFQNFTYSKSVPSATTKFQTKAALTIKTAVTQATIGAYTLKLDSTKYGTIAGNSAGVYNGILVSGNGVPPNSYIIGTSSGASTITVSNPLTAIPDSVTLSGGIPLLRTSHPNGIDGNLAIDSLSITAQTDFIFDSSTTTPFSSRLVDTLRNGNVTFNANATNNKAKLYIKSLTLNNGSFNVRPSDTIYIQTITSSSGKIQSNNLLIQEGVDVHSTKSNMLVPKQSILVTDKIKNL